MAKEIIFFKGTLLKYTQHSSQAIPCIYLYSDKCPKLGDIKNWESVLASEMKMSKVIFSGLDESIEAWILVLTP